MFHDERSIESAEQINFCCKRQKGTFEGYIGIQFHPHTLRDQMYYYVCVLVGASVAVDLGCILICQVRYIV